MRTIRVFFYAMCLLFGCASCIFAAGNEVINALPDANTSTFRSQSRTFWQNEEAARDARRFPSSQVISGGLHNASSTSCTTNSFATEVLTGLGNRVRADSAGTGAAAAINYSTVGCNCNNPGSATAWTIISAATGDSLSSPSGGSFTRMAGTNYFVHCSATTQPALPNADSAWLLGPVTITNGAITASTDLRAGSLFGVSILDFLNQTNPLQSAINALKSSRGPGYGGAGGTIVVPANMNIPVPTAVSVPSSLFGVRIRCDGWSSVFQWTGGNTATMLTFNGGGNGIAVEHCMFGRSGSQTGITAISINGSTPLSKSRIIDNLINDVATGIALSGETNEATIEENWIFSYATACIVSTGAASGSSISKNHCQGGAIGTIGISLANSSSVTMHANVIESGNNITAYRLNGTSSFSITNNYYENGIIGSGTDKQFVNCTNCDTGFISSNTTTGAVLGPVMLFDTASSDIVIGPNQHTCSGSITSAFVQAAAGLDAVHTDNIQILGPLTMTGCGASPVYTSGTGAPVIRHPNGRRIRTQAPFTISYPLGGSNALNELWQYTASLTNATPINFLNITVDASIRAAGIVVIEYAVVTVPVEAATKAAVTGGRYSVAITTDGASIIVGTPTKAEVGAVINDITTPTVTFSTTTSGRLVRFRVQQDDVPATNGATMTWRAAIIMNSLVAPAAIGAPN